MQAASDQQPMCNLYSVPPADAFEDYLRRHRGQMPLPGWPLSASEKLTVGPFDTGVFLTASEDDQFVVRAGQWGMIRPGQQQRIEYKEYPAKRPGAKPRRESMLKNNARIETVGKSPAFRDAWHSGRRCLIPALWLQEPNWETGKCVWWQLRRADALPWMVAGIWSEWTDPATGELVPNYAMITFNVNNHPLLSRLHRPEKDKTTGAVLPFNLQDKRGEAHIEPDDWMIWLHGDFAATASLLVVPPAEFYDQGDAVRTDAILEAASS